MLSMSLVEKPTWLQRKRAELKSELELLDAGIAMCDQQMVRFRTEHTAFSMATGRIVFRAERINDREKLEAEWRGLMQRRDSLAVQKSDVLQSLANLPKR